MSTATGAASGCPEGSDCGMKRGMIAAAAVFALFLIVGIWYNLQPGRYFHDEFWRLEAEGAYASAYGDRLCCEDGRVSLILDERELTAELDKDEDGWRVEFSDGWAVETAAHAGDVWIEVGGILLTGETVYEITDFDKAGLRFERADKVVRETFYGENGEPVGESVYRETETGEAVGWYEVWYDNPEFSMPEPETVLLREGMPLKQEDFHQKQFVNEAGEYLMDAQDAPMVKMSGGRWRDRASVAAMLIRAAEEEPGRRGSAAAVMLYAFVYAVGAATLLWPDQLAFFGSRWQYRSEPELSDAGRFAMQAGGVATMILGIAVLFIQP